LFFKERYGTYEDNPKLKEVFLENEDGTFCLREPVQWVTIYDEVITEKKNPKNLTKKRTKEEEEEDLPVYKKKKSRTDEK